MMWYGPGMGWWGYAGMGIGMVLFWALIIAGIVVLIRISTTDQRSQSTAPPQALSPEQILSARYAHGKINETEYRERTAVLRDHVRTCPRRGGGVASREQLFVQMCSAQTEPPS